MVDFTALLCDFLPMAQHIQIIAAQIVFRQRRVFAEKQNARQLMEKSALFIFGFALVFIAAHLRLECCQIFFVEQREQPAV
ncbi:hypothetical protein [Cardiobacterium valvarum]|uniref:hypothetical protein n=1 Tax=Cardiobacterium valvarum TaxID=194702 RepID=UPI0021C3C281|nr:hypothetical protein [Cardiobacterium valvarum]